MDEEDSMPDSTAAPGTFRVTRMYHPSHHAPDLAEVEDWFERVLGARSRNLREQWGSRPPADYPTSYSTFTPIADVLFDTIAPTLYVLNGVQQYPSVDTPHLKTIGWFAEGAAEAYRSLRRADIGMVDQFGRAAEGDDPPRSAGSGAMPIFFTTPEAAGLRHEFLPDFPFPLDHRNAPGWALSRPAPEDPVGIERSAYHTLLTGHPQRALHTLVDALGGTVVHVGRDEVIGAAATYVFLGDSLLQVAVPDEGTAAWADWATTAPADTYHSITWKVADTERVAAHLTSQGVSIRSRTADALVTDPQTSIGIPWGFTTRRVPGDPRD
jgi:catechol 2,3-dioxygenase-like lactoylglutathione lyase family enzyme